MMESLNKLAQLSEAQALKDQILALQARDSDAVRRLQKEHGGEPQQVAYQMVVIIELLPLLTLAGIKNELRRKAVVEGCRASFLAASNRVAFVAQKSRDTGLKGWCEQAQIVFADMSGYTEAAPKQTHTSSPRPPSEQGPTVGRISQDGNKYTVTGYAKQSEPVSLPFDLPQQASLCICDCYETIFKCDSAKLTAVQVDKCVGVGVILQGDVIASVDLINSRKCQVESSGHLPTLNIDCCDGLTIYLLSPASRNISIVSSRSSELNIVHPMGWYRPTKTVRRTEKRLRSSEGAEGMENEFEEVEVEEEVEDPDAEVETTELAIPVQFRSYFDEKSGTLVTEPMQHAGN